MPICTGANIVLQLQTTPGCGWQHHRMESVKSNQLPSQALFSNPTKPACLLPLPQHPPNILLCICPAPPSTDCKNNTKSKGDALVQILTPALHLGARLGFGSRLNNEYYKAAFSISYHGRDGFCHKDCSLSRQETSYCSWGSPVSGHAPHPLPLSICHALIAHSFCSLATASKSGWFCASQRQKHTEIIPEGTVL